MSAHRTRAVLCWGVFFVAALQVALHFTQHQQPLYHDPEFGKKLNRLRQQLAAKPGQPLALFLGTSRVVFGVRPDVLSACRTAEGQAPVIFNLGEAGTGPTFHLLYLNRLLQRGIRADYLFVEIWPIYLTSASHLAEQERLTYQPLEWCDLEVLRHYTDRPWDYYPRWLAAQFAPWYSSRRVLLRRCAPDWLPPSPAASSLNVDAQGWHAAAAVPEGPEKERLIREFCRPRFEAALRNWEVSAVEDGALREILSTCRGRGIAVALVVMPEGRAMRSWYRPATQLELARYLDRLDRDFGLPCIDARCWVSDRHMTDGIHLDRQGATAFSARFRREVLQPILEGRRPLPRAGSDGPIPTHPS